MEIRSLCIEEILLNCSISFAKKTKLNFDINKAFVDIKKLYEIERKGKHGYQEYNSTLYKCI